MSHKSIIPGVNRISRLVSYIFYFHGFLWSWNLFLFLTSLPLSLSSFLNIHSFPIIPLFHSIFQPCLPWYTFQLCSAPSGCYTWNFVSIYLPQEEERLEFLWTLLTQPWGRNPLGKGGFQWALSCSVLQCPNIWIPHGSVLLCTYSTFTDCCSATQKLNIKHLCVPIPLEKNTFLQSLWQCNSLVFLV